MTPKEKQRYNRQYKKHLQELELQGMSEKTIDVYSRAVRRLVERFDKCPDKVTRKQLKDHFSKLVKSHSWSTVRVDRNGLMFFWKYVLRKKWQWIDIVKPPQVKSIPPVLSLSEIQRMIVCARQLRYRVFIIVTYSLGLRLSEALNLQIHDIDSDNRRVHVRRGKGCKDRFVPLPDHTLFIMRHFWSKHRNPLWLFPRATHLSRLHLAESTMSYSATQVAVRQIIKDCGIKKKPLSTLSDTLSLPT